MKKFFSGARNQVASKYGIIVGVVYIILLSLSYKMVDNINYFKIMSYSTYVIVFLAIGIFGSFINKANEGTLQFRELFGVVFIMILISVFMSYSYSYIYMSFIDKQLLDKLAGSKNGTPGTYEFNLGNFIFGYFQYVIMHCLFGVLVSLILNRLAKNRK